MVNIMIVGRFSGPPAPPVGGGSRKIAGGPLFHADEVLDCVRNGKVTAVTQDCRDDLQKLEFDMDDLRELIEHALLHGKYKDSEWAQLNSRGTWAACDAYVVSREEYLPKIKKTKSVEYYLKFSMSDNGNVIFTVSCHT